MKYTTNISIFLFCLQNNRRLGCTPSSNNGHRKKRGSTGFTQTCDGFDTGSFMIQCEECRDWFHAACVNVTEE